MSAAVLILAAGHKRRMSEYSWLMSHESSYTIGGSHSEVREEVEQMEREEKMWSAWMENFSSRDQAYWSKTCRKRNFYLSAHECLEHGLVDEVI